jgi:CheY-like chemotaxis protein
VEDSQDDIDLALHALRSGKLGDSIAVVRDGEEALDFLFCRAAFSHRSFDRPPKLVLLDLKLPKIDGMQVLKEIKGDPRTQPIPVVIMTSSREERDIVEGYRSGVKQLYPETRGVSPVPRSGECPGPLLDGRQPASEEPESAGDERGEP